MQRDLPRISATLAQRQGSVQTPFFLFIFFSSSFFSCAIGVCSGRRALPLHSSPPHALRPGCALTIPTPLASAYAVTLRYAPAMRLFGTTTKLRSNHHIHIHIRTHTCTCSRRAPSAHGGLHPSAVSAPLVSTSHPPNRSSSIPSPPKLIFSRYPSLCWHRTGSHPPLLPDHHLTPTTHSRRRRPT